MRKWIHGIWRRLHRAFARQINQYPGTVAEYLTSRHATVKSVGRICFHLVENKRDAPPFAFLATYVNEVEMTGKVRHLPHVHGRASQRQMHARNQLNPYQSPVSSWLSRMIS